MDVLRKELNSIYSSQNLDSESLDPQVLADCKAAVMNSVSVDGDCRVITDASADRCCIFGGVFAGMIGIQGDGLPFCKLMDSGDEDIIYNRMHPEDLVEKRMLEYEFLKYADKLSACEKVRYKATCRIRLRDRYGRYVYVDNSTQVLRPSPKGRIWLILCIYDLSPNQETAVGISARIVNNSSGEVIPVSLYEKRSQILTAREKEILHLVKGGMPSKVIAVLLGISVHTVNRHRQNILDKLSVGNSVEAVKAASDMRLL